LQAIRRQLARLAAGNGTPVGHLGEDLARRLEDTELPGEITAELDDACARAGARLDPSQRSAFAARLLERGLDRCAPLDWSRTRRLLVVGPTGVGKTTTIAKLAGDLVINQRLSVGLVTIDTYRVGGQDQLRAYADLLDCPFEVATTPAHLADALARLANRDVVLIDTAGRNPADSARVHELKGFCRACPGLSVLLAAPANAGRAEFAAVVERFSVLPVEHAVVTKLDECAAPGRLYGSLRRHRLPVRWFTTGQEVPKDIEPASAARLAERVVGAPAIAQAEC
jgi:flagellar biosynthesis protein FlhF